MFGGTGIYRDGLIFALEAYGEILLKADAESAAGIRGGRFAAVHL
jgi:DNA transformation protein and related proteins